MDANVVVSAAISSNPAAPPMRVLDYVLARRVEALFSPDLLAEYREVLLRGPIRARHGRSVGELDRWLGQLLDRGTLVRPAQSPPEGPDPDDAHLWRLLRARPHGVLITGDKPLLHGHPDWATVMTPRRWLDEIDDGRELVGNDAVGPGVARED